MKVAIYIRVSTEEQAKEGFSISAQKQKLKAFCIAQDWDIAGLYADEGVSAKDINRPELQRMLKDIEDGKVDCVLVWRLDRLTRSVFDLYKLLDTFEKHNCKFKSATEVFDTTTAMGRMFITIVAAMAQWERENMGERIAIGLAEKARQGKYVYNKRLYGYNLNAKKGEMTIREDEAKVVRKIFDLYLNEGYGVSKICKYLNSMNIQTMYGNSWHDTSLMRLIRNPVYCGYTKWAEGTDHEIVIENVAPPIIDRETFERVQKTIEIRAAMSPRQVSSTYYFSSALKCNLCGRAMTGFYNARKTDEGKIKYKYYRCSRKNSGQCTGGRNISEIKLEKAFLEYISKIEFESAAKEVAEKGVREMSSTNENDERSELLASLRKIEKRKKKWQYAWSEDMISDEDFKNRMDEERKKEKEIKKQLEQIGEQAEKIEEVDKEELVDILKSIRLNWKYMNDTEKKSFVSQTIKRIYYKFKKDKVIIENIEFF